MDFNFSRNEGFIIGEKLKSLFLEILCILDVPTYPSLVREFYGTLARGSGGFTSRVRRIPMNITHTLLARVLNMSVEGGTPSIHSRERTHLNSS